MLALTKKHKAVMMTITLDCVRILGSDYETARTDQPNIITAVLNIQSGD